jgi:hypothetical protein
MKNVTSSLLHASCNANDPVFELLADQWDLVYDERMAYL